MAPLQGVDYVGACEGEILGQGRRLQQGAAFDGIWDATHTCAPGAAAADWKWKLNVNYIGYPDARPRALTSRLCELYTENKGVSLLSKKKKTNYTNVIDLISYTFID